MTSAMLMDMPLRSIAMMSEGKMSLSMMEGIVMDLNKGGRKGHDKQS